MFYTLINYFDVWGNSRDGFTVNNQCVECNDLYIDDAATNKDICAYLKNAGFLASDDMRRLAVTDTGSMIEITLKNGMPLFGLVPNN